MKKTAIILLLTSWYGFILAQNTYRPLVCEGDVPEDFRKMTRDKLEEDIKNEKNIVPNKNVSKTKRDFFLESNFLLNDLLLSGSVLYGDSLTVYVNKVADELLESDPELRSKLRFYCVKSGDVNAFATDPGMIFVTIGLIAELENEAQLAYILAHEIIHYKNRHVINSYIKEDQIAKSGRSRSTDDKIRSISNYSKENELEADSLGYQLFCKSAYNQKEAVNSIDLIQFSHLPLDEIPFSNSIYENELFKFTSEYHLDTLKQIDLFNDSDDDTYSSHPNIKKRRERLVKQSSGASSAGSKFILDETYFKAIQNLSRKEVLYQYSLSGNYMEGYYNAFVMQTKFPQNTYYKEMQSKFLYGMAKYKNNGDYSKVARYYTKIEGESQQAYYFFYNLTKPELNSIAAVDLYKRCESNPENEFLKKLRNDLFAELVSVHDIKLEEIKNAVLRYKVYKTEMEVTDTLSDLVIDSTETGDQKLSKFEKLRKEKEKSAIVKTETEPFKKFYLLAFSDVVMETSFHKYYLTIQDSVVNRTKTDKEEKDKLTKMSKSQKINYLDKRSKMSVQNTNIDLKKMVVVDPYYFEADSRKGLELLNSEEGVSTFNDNILSSGKAAEIEVELLSTKDLAISETEKFNDISFLNNFYEEFLMHDNEKMICFQSEYTTYLPGKYNTNYFNYSGLVAVKAKKNSKYIYILCGVGAGPLWPVFVIYAFMPFYLTKYESTIFDLSNNEFLNSEKVEFRARSNDSFIKSQIYYQFLKLKK
jgi:hypothetical protein